MNRTKVKLWQRMLLFCVMLLLNQQLFSQIKGRVTDASGAPIPGATILEKGTNNGIISDSNGMYQLRIQKVQGAVLVFSFVGMESQEIPVNGKSTINVTLKEVTQSVDEVVIVGYGSQKKATVTGAITSVNASELVKSPTGSLTTALAGRLPGLITMQRSGQPGAESPTLRIRGVSTLNGADPLVIVDGIERSSGYVPSGESSSSGGVSGYEQINPNDIESISILKDASSTAVYGVRGANGVIIITTKKGIRGKPKISVSGNYGMSTPIRLRNNVSSYEWGKYTNEGNANDGVAPAMTDEKLQHFLTGDSPILYPSINYVDYILKDFAPRQDYNLSMNGGTENVRYFVSAGYLNEEGLVKDVGFGFDPNYHYNRLNLRSNLDFDFTSSLSGSINIDSRIENRGGPNAPYDAAFFWKMSQAAPYLSPGFVDGKYVVSAVNSDGTPIMNWILGGGYYRSLQTTVNTVFSLKQKLDFLAKGLYAQGKFSYDSWYVEKYTRSRTYATYTPVDVNGTIYYKQSGADGQLSYTMDADNNANKRRKNYLELSLNYSGTFGEHTVTALALYNQSKSYFSESQYRDIPRAYLGFVSRFTYSYRNRYLAEFNFGLNGSENFPKGDGKRFGKFPAFSVGWVATEEPFMKQFHFLNLLKMRGSYGTVGNDQIGGQRFLYVSGSFANIPGGYTNYFGTETSTQSYLGLQEGRMANQDITWEVAKKANIGIETKFFKNQLTLNGDIFKENRSNILTYMATIPWMMMPDMQYGSTGWATGSIAPPANYAKVENKGYEIELGWDSKIGKMGYYFKASLAHAQNKRTLISEATQDYPWLYQQGQSIGQYYGLIAEGYFDSFGQIHNINNAYSTFGKNQIPGDIQYKDINGDMKIDSKDVVPIGYSNTPRKTFSFSLGMDYKGFDISALFQGVAQVSYIPADEAQIQFYGGNDAFDWVVNRWTPATRDASTYPVLHQSAYNYSSSNDFKTSTYWLKDASYVRLKNLEIGYNLPDRITKLAKISKTRIYLNGQNLFLWDKLKYWDPESIQSRLVLHPVMKIYNVGISMTF
ncbi:MAG: TonB-dependent receptor [Prolixibacteraceae bacterium]